MGGIFLRTAMYHSLALGMMIYAPSFLLLVTVSISFRSHVELFFPSHDFLLRVCKIHCIRICKGNKNEQYDGEKKRHSSQVVNPLQTKRMKFRTVVLQKVTIKVCRLIAL